jgi:signal transduction histidine kinase
VKRRPAHRRPPTLRRRLAVSLALLVLATLAVGGGGIVAVQGLHNDLGIATQGYRQLRQLYDVGFLVARARSAADATPPDPAAAAAAVRSALAALDARGGGAEPDGVDAPPPTWIDESARDGCRRLLAATPVRFDKLFTQLSTASADVRRSITNAQLAADHRRALAVRTVATLCAVVATAAVAMGIHQYRRVIGPVRSLTEGAGRFAAGEFDRRITATGDAEFVELAGDFNRMADELQLIYRDLEDRVRAASRDLARAERLASVGYLAAGVAHEINNPLGIIAGYGERALRQLPAEGSADVARVRQALTVMCDEAFRCKRITDQLLSLARPGDAGGRSAVSLSAVAADVADAVTTLPAFAGRHVAVTADPAGVPVTGNAGELRQVVLNLVVNSLEATTATGQVTVTIRPAGATVELAVTDDGRGMTPDGLARAFEPFYTDKPAAAGVGGTGLGLSLAHAIVAAHGGRLTAASGGPGRGSTFTVTLPAAG